LLAKLPRIAYKSLCGIIYAGEPCDANTGKYWSKYCKLYNYYGPTEATIYATGKQIIDGDTNLIGKPINNTTAYVLDKNLNLVPIGAIGELYVGGEGLARGYLNRPELTSERFISNPFQSEHKKQDKNYYENGRNARLYKTGDLVRWLPDGNLEYIGRNDDQVKIRGYRIELGEIESAISSYNGITQSVVLAREHTDINSAPTGNKYLVGYYVASHKFEEDDILKYLNSRLPEHMIPSILIYMEELPLTINGKLDRKALPKPEFTNIDKYVAPRNELEEKVCKIWAEVLGLPEDKVGINDDFFRLGGDSILAIRLISKLNKALITDKLIGISDIFSYKVLRHFSNHLYQESLLMTSGVEYEL
jgi:acyl-coenzyme A synthetase/AMP-(fatty) acid ligase